MELCPSHPIWKRERKAHHGGAIRVYDDNDDFTPRGPDASPLYCYLCEDQSNYSSTFTSGYLSLCSNEMSLLEVGKPQMCLFLIKNFSTALFIYLTNKMF